MKIKQIVMDTGEKYTFVAGGQCQLCAFYETGYCPRVPCGGGYWMKEDDKPVTNGDRIRKMTDEEIIAWVGDDYAERTPFSCPPGQIDCSDDCRGCWLDWLKSEYKDRK